jgi:hypothetical protein
MLPVTKMPLIIDVDALLVVSGDRRALLRCLPDSKDKIREKYPM